MIWISSDYHLFHDREFLYAPRGFANVNDMTQQIVINHNSVINKDDDVYLLGDLLLGGPNSLETGIKLLSHLNGKLHLVRGNHDSNKRWDAYKNLPNVVEMANAIYLDYNKYHFYLSHYPTITSNNDYDKSLKARLLNLCGHSHTKDKWADIEKGYIYHCELDCHNNSPVSIDNIIQDFKNYFPITLG